MTRLTQEREQRIRNWSAEDPFLDPVRDLLAEIDALRKEIFYLNHTRDNQTRQIKMLIDENEKLIEEIRFLNSAIKEWKVGEKYTNRIIQDLCDEIKKLKETLPQ